jgi:hypothetical protein
MKTILGLAEEAAKSGVADQNQATTARMRSKAETDGCGQVFPWRVGGGFMVASISAGNSQ